jgi:hypothetical protein
MNDEEKRLAIALLISQRRADAQQKVLDIMEAEIDAAGSQPQREAAGRARERWEWHADELIKLENDVKAILDS